MCLHTMWNKSSSWHVATPSWLLQNFLLLCYAYGTTYFNILNIVGTFLRDLTNLSKGRSKCKTQCVEVCAAEQNFKTWVRWKGLCRFCFFLWKEILMARDTLGQPMYHDWMIKNLAQFFYLILYRNNSARFASEVMNLKSELIYHVSI